MNQASSPETSEDDRLTPELNTWLEKHLERIRKLIVDEACRRAERDKGGGLIELHLADAARLFAPGTTWPSEPTLWRRIEDKMNPIAVVSGCLALAFGILGWLASAQQGGLGSTQTYWDIVKLFAGAIVGSLGTAVVPRRE